jgi:formimidoylglutamate deiminase
MPALACQWNLQQVTYSTEDVPLMPGAPPRLFAATALLPGGWATNVAVAFDAHGTITEVAANAVPLPTDALVAGPLVPAMPNLHSHAFQRAMAGLAEVAGPGADDFWTWRDLMYRTALALTPEDVVAITAKLCVELLKGGFGALAEFHYLHHAQDGIPYANRAAMAEAVLAGAAEAGMAMTLLPVFYAHSNFGGQAPTTGQRRFINDVDSYLRLVDAAAVAARHVDAHIGMAFHSLRAATPDEMRELLAANLPGPIHIHVAEQQREVADSLAWSQRRPVEWVLAEMPVDARWCLVHATQMTLAETQALAASGAVAGLCPMTEANLGDGTFDGVDYRKQLGAYGIGTDSHISVSVAEELRQLEYSQRLRDRQRNRLTDPNRSVGRTIFDGALAGGAKALGQKLGRIEAGYDASFLVLDSADPFIGTARNDEILDRWTFVCGNSAVRDVMVRGKWRIINRHHENDAKIDAAFRDVLSKLSAL